MLTFPATFPCDATEATATLACQTANVLCVAGATLLSKGTDGCQKEHDKCVVTVWNEKENCLDTVFELLWEKDRSPDRGPRRTRVPFPSERLHLNYDAKRDLPVGEVCKLDLNCSSANCHSGRCQSKDYSDARWFNGGNG